MVRIRYVVVHDKPLTTLTQFFYCRFGFKLICEIYCSYGGVFNALGIHNLFGKNNQLSVIATPVRIYTRCRGFYYGVVCEFSKVLAVLYRYAVVVSSCCKQGTTPPSNSHSPPYVSVKLPSRPDSNDLIEDGVELVIRQLDCLSV